MDELEQDIKDLRATQHLTVGELVARLSRFPAHLPVSVSDGYGFHFYNRLKDSTMELYVDLDGSKWVDIGVGGCESESV